MIDAMNDMKTERLLAIADDKLMLGHRNSDWTGLGPILEEDIAFSALAQGDIAHAQAIYEYIGGQQDRNADQIAFGRAAEEYRCAAIVEIPDDFDWAVALARQFYCAHFDMTRFATFADDDDPRLAALMKRLAEEQVAHVDHADSWLRRLGQDAAARQRIQDALDRLAPQAAMLTESADDLAPTVHARWTSAAEKAGFTINLPAIAPDVRGGRRGVHTEHFAPLLDEMCEVFRIEPDATW